MSKEDDKKSVLNQFAWILNYQPTIKEQHIHMGNQTVEDKPKGEEADDGENSSAAKMDSQEKELNYAAPTIVLQRMLEDEWFDRSCTNKALYHKDWRRQLVADLMASQHGERIAELWEHRDKRQIIKGKFLGTLVEAGVLEGSKLAIAREFLGINKNTRDRDEKKEASTFANYMGQGIGEPYLDWIKDYVKVQRG